jgi:hypothetical protein
MITMTDGMTIGGQDHQHKKIISDHTVKNQSSAF